MGFCWDHGFCNRDSLTCGERDGAECLCVGPRSDHMFCSALSAPNTNTRDLIFGTKLLKFCVSSALVCCALSLLTHPCLQHSNEPCNPLWPYALNILPGLWRSCTRPMEVCFSSRIFLACVLKRDVRPARSCKSLEWFFCQLSPPSMAQQESSPIQRGRALAQKQLAGPLKAACLHLAPKSGTSLQW